MMTATNSISGDINKLSNSDLISAKQTIDKEIEALRVMESELDSSLTDALNLMQAARGRIILTGMGKSGHIAKKIAEVKQIPLEEVAKVTYENAKRIFDIKNGG